jgi:hypothetical protein
MVEQGATVMGPEARFPSKLTKLDQSTQFKAAYVREIADELANAARSAGCQRLSALLSLASVEAQRLSAILTLASVEAEVETALPVYAPHLAAPNDPQKSDQPWL